MILEEHEDSRTEAPLSAFCRRIGLAVLASIVASVSLTSVCSAGKKETVHIRIWKAPRFGSDHDEAGLHRSLVVLEGESAENWTEAIEIINAKREGLYKDPVKLSEMLRALRHENCKSVQDSILLSNQTGVLYSQISDSCAAVGAPPERSFTRILAGKTTWILIYTCRSAEMTAESRKSVIDAFAAAELVKQ
jgi:hypothetical protein